MNFSQSQNTIFDSLTSLPPSTTFLLVVVAVLLVLKEVTRNKRRRPRRKKTVAASNKLSVVGNSATDMTNPSNQLEYVAKVGFTTQRLLNKEEYPLMQLLETATRTVDKSARVMAQTSLGEIIKTTNVGSTKQERFYAFKSINSKRLDFAVFSRTGHLVLAVEYQGSGHYNAKSFIRDAVKREVVRKAGVQYLEIPVGYNPDEISAQVKSALYRGLKIAPPAVPNNAPHPDRGPR